MRPRMPSPAMIVALIALFVALSGTAVAVVGYARNAGVLAVAPHLGLGDPTIGWLNAAFRLMEDFADPEYARAYRRDQALLWLLAIGLPFVLTGIFKGLATLL